MAKMMVVTKAVMLVVANKAVQYLRVSPSVKPPILAKTQNPLSFIHVPTMPSRWWPRGHSRTRHARRKSPWGLCRR